MAIFDPKHESTDNYFDRLDAAFSTLSASPRPARPETPAEIEPAAGAGSSVIAETFAALLALEEGAPGAKPVRLVSAEAEPRVTDALVEELTGKVVQRLAPDAVRAVVVDVVSEIAERLVKEEIARIRKGPNA
jgi:hypothetical protein